jgi:hypothetical protein
MSCPFYFARSAPANCLGAAISGYLSSSSTLNPTTAATTTTTSAAKKRLSTLSPFGLLFILPSREQCFPQE